MTKPALKNTLEDETYQFLTNPHSIELNIVLFIDSCDSTSAEIVEKFTGLNVPEVYHKLVIDTQKSSKVVNYFGILETPSVAIISRGSIVGLMTECTDDACKWIVECAKKTILSLEKP